MNALDIGRVDRVEVLSGRYTIHDIKRIVAVDRTHTAYTNGVATRTRSCVRCNLNARQATLHGAQHVGIRFARWLAHVHHAYCTRQVGLALSGITGYNQFFKNFSVFLKTNGHHSRCYQLLRFVTYITKLKRSALVDRKRELTVKVGHCSVLRTNLEHCSTNYCITIACVRYHTVNSHSLSQRYRGHQEHAEQKRETS